MLLRSKLGFLNFSAAAGWDPTEVLQTYLAAACDPNEQARGGPALCDSLHVDTPGRQCVLLLACRHPSVKHSLRQERTPLTHAFLRGCAPLRFPGAATSC